MPRQLAKRARQDQIADELLASKAEILVLLGDQPIRWFSARWHSTFRRLWDFGGDEGSYGRLHEATIAGRRIRLLPLAHPRQVAKLGRSSAGWHERHSRWMTERAGTLIP